MPTPPRHRRGPTYTVEKWRWFDAQDFDAGNHYQVAMVADLLTVNAIRVYEAIGAVGSRGKDIRKYIDQRRH
jgi:hypothetical protein